MRVIVVGLGVQGRKRLAVAGKEAVATVDPVNPEAGYKRVEDVPIGAYDAALVCTPDAAKIDLLTYLLSNGKHLLVEKPLFADDPADLLRLKALALAKRTVCYTASNHRFEPHFIRMKELIDSGRLGRIFCVRMFYGNGTAMTGP
jgi:predicted dehydrogenase